MKVFVIIVTYNAMHRGWIDKCMASLSASTLPVTPVIIDNGSADGTREHVPAHFPEAVWLPQDRNLGFGQANNRGIQYALEHGADYVLLLNQDATLAPDAVEHMVEACAGNRLVSPLQLNGDGTRLDFIFKEKLLLTRSPLFDDIFAGQAIQEAYEGGNYSAACWMLPAKLIREIGGFNPIFFHYGEDDNYLHRVQYHGFKVALAAKAQMFHDREIHGNQDAFNKNAYRREMLCEACDINISLLKFIGKSCLRLYHSYVFDLRAHQYLPGTFFRQALWLCQHISAIRSSRRQDRCMGMNWL